MLEKLSTLSGVSKLTTKYSGKNTQLHLLIFNITFLGLSC